MKAESPNKSIPIGKVFIVTAGLLLGACSAYVEVPRGAEASEAIRTQSSPRAGPRHAVSQALKRYRSTRIYERVPSPRRLRIPAIGVDSRLQLLGRNADGSVEVPVAWDVAGWFSKGPVPGERGPAVILGHVDSRSGPAVFYRLRELEGGDAIFVEHEQGHITRFVVDRLEQFDKNKFPTEVVYFPTLKPVLRLITCGGEFDQSSGHYRDNIIVFASLRRVH